MPYLKKIVRPHDCDTPPAEEISEENLGAGTLWQCPECRVVWKLTQKQILDKSDPDYGAVYFEWVEDSLA